MQQPESSGPGMNIAPVVYLVFIVEGNQVLFMLEAGTAGCLSQLLPLEHGAMVQRSRSGTLSGTSGSETSVQDSYESIT